MTNSSKPNILFWIISIIALLWNAMGVNAYIQQAYKTDAFKAMYEEEHLEMVLNTPSWVMAAFALAVFGGLLGCILLLLRKKLALIVFLISLIAIIIQMTYNVFLSKALEVYGPGVVIMPIMVIVVAVYLYFYTKKSIDRGWIS